MLNAAHAVPRLSAIAALALCACATPPKPPGDAIRAAANAIAHAENARASDFAGQEMRAARDKLQAAREASRRVTTDKNDQNALHARWLAEEASADAALAEAEAARVRTQSVVRELQRNPPAPSPAPPPSGG